ncbi:MAG: LytTR family DNA-binding domain-containing protein [Saprospiraceae bacterium]|nr:LytTR family DNA-binding domain-containing protein [Saprospiraceae bacterium]
MLSFLSRLSQPYPFEVRWLSGFRNGFWAGVFVTAFLFFFKPFGTDVTPGKEAAFLAMCAAFGLVTLAISLFINGICLLLPSVFAEEKWNVGKEIVFNLFFIACIGTGNLLLAHFLWNAPLSSDSFWQWQGATFAIGIFPSVFGAFLTQMRLNKKYAVEAAHLHISHTPPPESDILVTLVGENQDENLTLPVSKLVYLAAQDNYVQVFFLENQTLKHRLLRATLRKMEESLAGHPAFFRCHRTYIVNFSRVENISGNAQGYRLQLSGATETIPVSRSLNDAVRARLSANTIGG